MDSKTPLMTPPGLADDTSPAREAATCPARKWLFATSEGRLTMLLGATVVIAIVFSGIGLWLYNASGTAQLDLSRPGYEGVGQELERDKKTQPVQTEYSATGPIDDAALKEFNELYTKQLDSMKKVDAFGGDPMSLDGLGISENPSSTVQ